MNRRVQKDCVALSSCFPGWPDRGWNGDFAGIGIPFFVCFAPVFLRHVFCCGFMMSRIVLFTRGRMLFFVSFSLNDGPKNGEHYTLAVSESPGHFLAGGLLYGESSKLLLIAAAESQSPIIMRRFAVISIGR